MLGFDLCELDLWPWPFEGTSLLSLVTTPENFMMIRWWKHSQKCVTDRRTDWTIHRAAWSQLQWLWAHNPNIVEIIFALILILIYECTQISPLPQIASIPIALNCMILFALIPIPWFKLSRFWLPWTGRFWLPRFYFALNPTAPNYPGSNCPELLQFWLPDSTLLWIQLPQIMMILISTIPLP